jgi:hypothetical protein
VLAGCGGSHANPPSAVARVQSSLISKESLAHWTVLKRIELESSATSAPAARLREKALRFLITSQWLQQEAAARGVSVSMSETEAFYDHLLSGPNGAQFAAGLKRRGLARADELLVLRVGELAEKLRAQITGPLHGPATPAELQRVATFIAAYRQRWKQRTTCEPGYVIAECRNGPPLPRASATGR